MSDDERKHLEGLDEQTERERWEEFHAADRDDLAAILAKHEPSYQVDGDYGERQWIECTCDSEYFVDTDAGWAAHRAHVAQMVLESDWLRGVKADAWDECIKPFRHYGFTNDNPYRADRVDAEDGGR